MDYSNGNFFPYSHTISVKVTSVTKTRYFLPDDDILRGKRIVGVSLRRQDDSDDSRDVNGDTLVADDIISASFLTIEADSVRVLNQIPMDLIAFDANADTRYVAVEFAGFTPSKSVIDISDAANLAANEVFELTFFYTEYNA